MPNKYLPAITGSPMAPPANSVYATTPFSHQEHRLHHLVLLKVHELAGDYCLYLAGHGADLPDLTKYLDAVQTFQDDFHSWSKPLSQIELLDAMPMLQALLPDACKNVRQHFGHVDRRQPQEPPTSVSLCLTISMLQLENVKNRLAVKKHEFGSDYNTASMELLYYLATDYNKLFSSPSEQEETPTQAGTKHDPMP